MQVRKVGIVSRGVGAVEMKIASAPRARISAPQEMAQTLNALGWASLQLR